MKILNLSYIMEYVQETAICGRSGQPGKAILLRSETEKNRHCYREITNDEALTIDFFFGDTRCIKKY